MARDIAHGEISISVDLEKVGAELRAAEAQVQRSMANIDRMSAEADIAVDKKQLRRDIADVKSELRLLEAEDIEIDAELAKTKLKKDILEAKAMLKELDAEKVKVDVDAKELDELAAAEKRLADQRKKWARERDQRFIKEGQMHLTARKRFDDEMSAEGRLHMLARKRYDDEMSAEGRLHMLARKRFDDEMVAEGKMQMLARQRVREDHNRAVELENLKTQYIRLHDEVEKGSKLKMFDFLGDETARTRFAKTEAELKRIKHRIVEIGGRDVAFHKLELASDSAGSRLRAMASSLGSVRLQMGFFSATLRQTAIGFTALGPIIFGLVGQISSLVGVLGTGLVGALSVASAGIAGFGLSALGIGLIMKPLIGDLQDSMKASKAYGDAVRKYGKDSTQAATAQEKLNQTLGDVGPATRRAFQSISSMSDRWGQMTAGARPAFFEAIASGIKAANRLMPMFARESVRTFKVASDSAQKWTDALSSPGGESGIQQLLANFRRALPSLNAGFLSLGSSLGKISVAASHHLPSLMRGFATWAGRLGSSDINSTMARLVEHMRQVGHFAQSAGRMMASFFNAGANEGASLLSTLTNIFNRWNSWMNTAEGQNSLANFFAQANRIGSQFVGSLAQMGVALFEFSSAFAPLSQGFLMVVRGATQLTAAVMGLSAARAVVTGLGAAIAAAFVGGKVLMFVGALRAIPAAIAAIRTALAAGGIAALFATPAGPWLALGAAIVGVGAALSQILGSSGAATTSLQTLQATARGVTSALSAMAGNDVAAATAGLQLASATQAKKAAQNAYNAAVDKYGANSKQAQAAEAALQQATVNRQQAAQQMNQAAKTGEKTYSDAIKKTGDELDKSAEKIHKLEDAVEANKGRPTRVRQYEEAVRDLRTETKRYNDLLRQQERLNNRQALSDLNATRAAQGRAPVLAKVGGALRELRQEMGQTAQGAKAFSALENIGGSPKQVANVVKMSSALQGMGKMSRVNKILINSSSIEEALAKLRKLREETARTEKKKKIDVDADTGSAKKKMGALENGFKRRKSNIDVGANTKKAEADINKVSRKKGNAKVSVAADTRAANAAINRISSRKIPAKRVQISAKAGEAITAIARLASAKIPPKKFEVKANTGEADAANRKVQSFRDKTVHVKTQADTSGATAAQSAINSIPSNTNKYITIIERKVKAAAQGSSPSDQPVPNATRSAGPRVSAADRRNAGTAREAGVRTRRAGLYKRPTLLVGEERQDEYVIATNPSYRAANEGYLRDAAARFGYQLAPIEMAAKGKKGGGYKPLKYNTGARKPKKIIDATQRFPRYDFLQGEISRWGDIASGRESRRAQDIEIDGTSSIGIGDILGAYQSQMGAYMSLRSWLTKQVRRMAGRSRGKSGTMAQERKWGNKANSLKKTLKNQRKDLRKTKSDKKRKAIEKKIAKTERALTKATDRRDKARNKTRDANTMSGQFSRELRQQLPGQMYNLDTTIKRWQAIKDGDLPDPAVGGGSGGGGSTPMGVQLGALDAARYDVFNQFAGNIAGSLPGIPAGGGAPGLVGAAGPSGGTGSPSFYAAGGSPTAFRAPAGAAAAGAAASGGGGTTVTQNINISEPPPDPHSFSKQLGWEAGLM